MGRTAAQELHSQRLQYRVKCGRLPLPPQPRDFFLLNDTVKTLQRKCFVLNRILSTRNTKQLFVSNKGFSSNLTYPLTNDFSL